MWIVFALSSALLVLILYFPGAIICTACKGYFSASALSAAPSISIGLLSILAVVTGYFGISGETATVVMIVLPLILSFLLYQFRNKANRREAHGILRSSFIILFLYCLFSTIIVSIFFVSQLDGPSSFFQQPDNVSHLAKIKEIAIDGNYSTLTTSSYPLDLVSSGKAPYSSVSFYPNGFLVLASFAVSILGVSAPLAENSAVFVFAAFVYPSAMYYLIKTIFNDDVKCHISGILATSAFASFPLALLVFGPLYPTMAAFCCVPAVAATFINLFSLDSKNTLVVRAFLFILMSVGAATLQPNSIFTLGVFLIPFCCKEIYKYVQRIKPDYRGRALLASFGFILFVIILWVGLYKSPALSSVTSFNWTALDDPISGIFNVLTLSLRIHVPQFLLSILTIFGIIITCLEKGRRWLCASFLLMCCLYYFGNTSDTIIKQILTGFWYSDQWRTAASCAIMAVPLATAGITKLISILSNAVSFVFSFTGSKFVYPVMTVFVLSLLFLYIFEPGQLSVGFNTTDSAFGYIAANLESSYRLGNFSGYNTYTSEEAKFIEKVKEIVQDGELIINMPYDGSVFAYLHDDLNLYYKTYKLGTESDSSKLIRQGLKTIDDNDFVKAAVEEIGAQYILLLEKNGYTTQGDSEWSLYGTYKPRQWKGLSTDLDNCQSCETLLSEGNMRLYRIII